MDPIPAGTHSDPRNSPGSTRSRHTRYRRDTRRAYQCCSYSSLSANQHLTHIPDGGQKGLASPQVMQTPPTQPPPPGPMAHYKRTSVECDGIRRDSTYSLAALPTVINVRRKILAHAVAACWNRAAARRRSARAAVRDVNAEIRADSIAAPGYQPGAWRGQATAAVIHVGGEVCTVPVAAARVNPEAGCCSA